MTPELSTTTAEEWKQKGNASFKDGDIEAAIKAYSSAIELCPDNSSYYSNRSAAYLQKGETDKAFADADQCIALDKSNHLGYIRKGAAYHAQREYDLAISTMMEGIEVCPNKEKLFWGLQMARCAKARASSASKSFKTTEAVKRANKRMDTETCSSVSAIIQQTRVALKLQMTEVQAKLNLIDSLATMDDEAKLYLLFTLIDRNGDTRVDARELLNALRQRKEKISFQCQIDNAVGLVAEFDADGDGKLDFVEFQKCVNLLMTELNVTLAEFSEFLIFQINAVPVDEDSSFSDAEAEKRIRERGVLYDLLSNERMADLFELFDKDNSGELTFKEVATGLFQITRNVEESSKTAMNLLLTMDKKDTRTLRYEQFGRLIMAIVAASNSTFDAVADDLTLALSQNEELTPDELDSLTVADVIYETARKEAGATGSGSLESIVDSLSYGRLKKLFDLWDFNGDGTITFAELATGIQVFQDGAGIVGNPENEARALFGFDGDGNECLDSREFAEAMMYYAKSFGIALHDLIDFMCVTTVTRTKDELGFQKAFGRSLRVADKVPSRPARRLSARLDD